MKGYALKTVIPESRLSAQMYARHAQEALDHVHDALFMMVGDEGCEKLLPSLQALYAELRELRDNNVRLETPEERKERHDLGWYTDFERVELEQEATQFPLT